MRGSWAVIAAGAFRAVVLLAGLSVVSDAGPDSLYPEWARISTREA